MTDLLCPFSAPLVKKDFGCKNAKEIIRRGGAEIACGQSDAHALCSTLHYTIKTAALKAMDLEDDLLALPHNVLLKIQYGGLLGLRKLTEVDSRQDANVDNIALLVLAAMAKFTSADNIPLASINETIIDYRVQRRGKNR